MAFRLSRSEITLKVTHILHQVVLHQGLLIVVHPEKAPSMLVNFPDAFIFVISAETEYIFCLGRCVDAEGRP